MRTLILECIVRSVLIAACTAIALYVLRVRAARVRHAMWASVVVFMLALPAWTVWGPKAVLRVLKPEPVVAVSQTSVVVMAQQVLTAPPVVEPKHTWSSGDYLFGIYLPGFVILMARLVTGTVRARMLVRRAGGLEGRLTNESCMSPITVGVLKPVVILPDGWVGWPEAQLNAVLTHEGEHASRRDPLVQWLALFNRAVFWFHPLAWWLERRLSGLAEEACDDAVLMRGHDPLQYSECLLGLARAVQESGARVGVVGMAMPGMFLPARIRRIVEGDRMQKISRGRLVSLGLVCAVVSTVFTVGAVGYSAPDVPVRAIQQQITAPVESAAPLLHSRGSKVPFRVLVAQAVPAPAPARGGFTVDGVTDLDGGMRTPQSLFGVVTDPSGAVVPNALVALAGSDKAAIQYSNNTGRFRFQNIDADTYSVNIKVTGFRSLSQTGIAVSAGEAHNVGAMPLMLGTAADSVSITGSKSAAQVAAPVGNPLGPATSLVQVPAPPVGIPLDQKAGLAAAATDKLRAEQAGLQNRTSSGPVRVGGNVQPAKLVKAIRPVYPPDLQRAGVEGTVKFEAVITKDGTVGDLKVVGGNPLLVPAAEEAVKQWRYTPTMLNGEPVEILITTDVNFSLAD